MAVAAVWLATHRSGLAVEPSRGLSLSAVTRPFGASRTSAVQDACELKRPLRYASAGLVAVYNGAAGYLASEAGTDRLRVPYGARRLAHRGSDG